MNKTENDDLFAKFFYYIIPWTVPVIVTLSTYLFYSLVEAINMNWLPLILIYWATIWGFTLFYQKMRGGVFYRERFKLTLKLKGEHLKLQYLLTYGPLLYTIPIFIISYAIPQNISFLMYIAILGASIINGPSEEVYWRACLEEAGKRAGVSDKRCLAYSPIMFAFWHNAFVIHLVDWTPSWWFFEIFVLLITWNSGIMWMWVMHKSERLIPQAKYHSIANFFTIFPILLVTVIGFYF